MRPHPEDRAQVGPTHSVVVHLVLRLVVGPIVGESAGNALSSR
jgi:hypothetical protein